MEGLTKKSMTQALTIFYVHLSLFNLILSIFANDPLLYFLCVKQPLNSRPMCPTSHSHFHLDRLAAYNRLTADSSSLQELLLCQPFHFIQSQFTSSRCSVKTLTLSLTSLFVFLSFNKYLDCEPTKCYLCIFPCSEATIVNTLDKISCFHGACILVGKSDNKQN